MMGLGSFRYWHVLLVWRCMNHYVTFFFTCWGRLIAAGGSSFNWLFRVLIHFFLTTCHSQSFSPNAFLRVGKRVYVDLSPGSHVKWFACSLWSPSQLSWYKVVFHWSCFLQPGFAGQTTERCPVLPQYPHAGFILDTTAGSFQTSSLSNWEWRQTSNSDTTWIETVAQTMSEITTKKCTGCTINTICQQIFAKQKTKMLTPTIKRWLL